MTAPNLRELAEEIAEAINAGRDDNFIPWAEEADHWEDRLRAALPELSNLLGELAVAKGALRAVDYHLKCDCNDCRHRVKWDDSQHKYYFGYGTDGPTAHKTGVAVNVALSSDAGRLAGELIRAVIEGHLLDESVDDLVSHERLADDDNKQEIPDLVEEFNRASAKRQTSHQRQKLAADALLAAFPAIRAEVENG